MEIKLFEDDLYIRKAVFGVTLLCVPVWLILGLDSGVGMIERAILNFPLLFSDATKYINIIYDIYGRSFHFSTYVIYGFLYVGISKHLAKNSITKTKNVVYSILLVMFNAALFEWTYMVLLVRFQTNWGLLTWFTRDFMFLSQYLGLLMFGVYGVLLLKTEKVELGNKWKLYILSVCTTSLFFNLWIYYGLWFPVAQATFNGWTSSLLFPQTHYAYIHPTLYFPNTGLHIVNVVCKALLALTQLTFVWRLKKRSGTTS